MKRLLYAFFFVLFLAAFYVVPSVGLYWVNTGDPTTGAGVAAPQGQLLIRNDGTPSIYYHASGSPTAWTQVGIGSTAIPPSTAPTILSPGSQLWVMDDMSSKCASANCGYFDNTSFNAPGTCTQIAPTAVDGALRECQTGGTSGAVCLQRSTNPSTADGATVKLGSFACDNVWRLRWPLLSTGTNGYTTQIGFGNWCAQGTGTEDNNGIFATYDHTNLGDVFALETRAAGVSTKVKCDGTGGTTNEPIVANTFYVVDIGFNAAGTQATLSVNGTQCATSTTNIPTSGLSVGAQHIQTISAVSRNVDINWMYLYCPNRTNH